MGIFGKNGGVLDVIRCDEPSYLIWKWHPAGSKPGENRRENAIRIGSALRVRDGEVAVFAYPQTNGVVQDYILGPYDGYLHTKNLPVLSGLVGLAYGGDTPFQASVYFVNLAQIIQVRFGVPFFDVYDPRYPDFSVPVAVRGTISFQITDYQAFIKLHRLDRFTLADFEKQIRDAVSRYVKDTVTNAPAEHNIPVIQIESKTGMINDGVEYTLSQRLRENFGVTVSGVDIGAIEIDKTSDGYRQLLAITRDVTAATLQAQKEATIADIRAKQRMDAEHYGESLRIQREEGQYAQRMQTRSSNISAYQMEKQTEVGVAGAQALGQMGANGTGGVDLGGGNMGFNPAAMMASMAVGGVVGQNIAGAMSGAMAGMQQTGPATPPPIPQVLYHVAVNGRSEGPYDLATLKQMARTGQFTKDSLVWKMGMLAWEPAATEEALKSVWGEVPPEIPKGE